MDVDKQVQPQSQPKQPQQQQHSAPADNVPSSNPRPVALPVSRVKTIMKTCPDTSMISQEAAVVVTKSTVSVWVHANLVYCYSNEFCAYDMVVVLE